MRKSHARATAKLDRWFQRNLGETSTAVRVQLPLTLRGSEPEPDVAIVEEERGRRPAPSSERSSGRRSGRHVGPLDLDVKARIYARARIPEYWLIVVGQKRVEVLRDIDPRKGAYRARVTVPVTGTLEPAAFPGLKMPVRALFD